MKRPVPGDVFSVERERTRLCVQYLGRHPHYGDAIAVGSVLDDPDPQLDAAKLDGSYVVFYPIGTALRKGMAKKLGNLPHAGIPPRLRRPGAVERNGDVITWIIETESGDLVTWNLTPEERTLPIAQLWNHATLFDKVAANYRPNQEVSRMKR